MISQNQIDYYRKLQGVALDAFDQICRLQEEPAYKEGFAIGSFDDLTVDDFLNMSLSDLEVFIAMLKSRDHNLRNLHGNMVGLINSVVTSTRPTVELFGAVIENMERLNSLSEQIERDCNRDDEADEWKSA